MTNYNYFGCVVAIKGFAPVYGMLSSLANFSEGHPVVAAIISILVSSRHFQKLQPFNGLTAKFCTHQLSIARTVDSLLPLSSARYLCNGEVRIVSVLNLCKPFVNKY